MADFDAFESAPSGEVDPAADFLAREQSELAGLEDDNFCEAPQDSNQGIDGFEQPTESAEPVQQNTSDRGLADSEMLGSGNDDFGGNDGGLLGGGFSQPPEESKPANASDGGMADFEMLGGGNDDFGGNDGGLLDGGFSQPPEESKPANASDGGMADFEMLGGGNDDFGGNDGGLLDGGESQPPEESEPSTNGPSNIYEAVMQQDTARAVPEKIKIWREEQEARLEKKDAEEESRKKELKEKAKKELDDWYKHHAEQLEKTKENNRAAENAFIKDRDETVPGQSWEKIARLCEFNPKNSKCTKDVTRYRSILLQLKQTPLVR